MIVTSLLDSDFYKVRMQQMILHQFPKVYCEFEFKNRTLSGDLTPYVAEIREEVKNLCSLTYTKNELDYLRSIGMERSYTDFLRNFRLNYDDINIREENDKLKITTSGNWFHTSSFEIHILSIVNEIYFKHKLNGNEENVYAVGREKLNSKIALLKKLDSPLNLIEFGTRRRFSKDWQEHVLRKLIGSAGEHLVGTSNLMFSKELDIKPIGSMAHEIFQAAQVLSPNLISFQEYIMSAWLKEYPKDPGFVLTDIVGIDAFLRAYKPYNTKFTGGRHDSGCPYLWAGKWIEHHKFLSKRSPMLFSDGLSIEKAIEIKNKYTDYPTLFGIGTSLTNNLGIPALQIVMKMTSCNGKPVAKISDSEGKLMCNDNLYVSNLLRLFKNE